MIRELSIEDYDAVIDLWRRAGLATLRPEGRDSREDFARQLDSGNQTVLGIERDGELAAVVVLGSDGRKGWINRLAVAPEARRRGLARRLLSEGERRLRDRGLRVIAALVQDDNDPSLELFRSAGYTVARHVLYLSKRDSTYS